MSFLNVLLKIGSLFSKKERWLFTVAFLVFIASLSVTAILILKNSTFVAAANGGEYAEGVIGQPVFINPILAQTGGVEADLTELIFPSIEEMLDYYAKSPDFKVVDIRIKGDIAWEDGAPITSDDIIFTINAIQDPLTDSPSMPAWQGIKTERISEREIRFVLPQNYAFFDQLLLSLRIAPKHMLSEIPPANLKFSDYNLKPLGGGKFKAVSFEKRRDGFITAYILERNEKYFGTKPHLDKITFNFYPSENDLMDAFNNDSIDGLYAADYISAQKISAKHEVLKIQTPRYYGVFFNQGDNDFLKNKNLRLALDLAIDKEKITREVFGNDAFLINGPISFENNSLEFSLEHAKELIKSFETENLGLKLTVYPMDSLIKVSQIIKESWEALGIKTDIYIAAQNSFNEEIIKPRNYEALLFGNIYGRTLDPYSFWHSSQKFYPGLNLSLFGNALTDNLIEGIRSDFSEQSRQEKIGQLESLINEARPAIFLYSPYYLYITDGDLKGFDEKFLPLMSDRFRNVEKWYIKTIRKFK